jgi:hypothetical protein
MPGLASTILSSLVVVAAVVLALPACAAEPAPSCAASPKLVGQCFTVHGRLTACTGVPNARIWIVGTKRILGVADAKGDVAATPLLPGSLEDEMFSGAPCSKAAFGDYTVCPLTRSRPGVMQRVCVDGAARLRITEDW